MNKLAAAPEFMYFTLFHIPQVACLENTWSCILIEALRPERFDILHAVKILIGIEHGRIRMDNPERDIEAGSVVRS